MKSGNRWVILLVLTLIFSTMAIGVQAASNNSLQKTIIKVEKNHIFHDVTTANALRIGFNDNSGQDERFYLELKNAVWNEEALTRAFGEPEFKGENKIWRFIQKDNLSRINVAYIKESDEVMQVLVDGATINVKSRYSFPLLVQATGNSAIVSLKGGTTLTEGNWTFASTADNKITWSVGTVNTISTSGKLADLKITESYKGAMKEETRIGLEIDSSEFVFDISGEVVESKYDREGYTTYQISGNDNVNFLNGFYNRATCFYMLVNEDDKGVAEIIIPGISGGSIAGVVEIKNLYVKTKISKPTEGDLHVNVILGDLGDSKDGVTFAKVEQYGIFAEVTGNKAVEIAGGHVKDVELVIGEKVDDSLIGNRTLTMTMDTACYDFRTLLLEYGNTGKTKAQMQKMTDDEVLALNPILDLEKLKRDRKVQLVNNVEFIKGISFGRSADGKINPKCLEITTIKGVEDNGIIDRVRLVLPIYVPIDNRQLESTMLTIDGSAADTSKMIQLVTIKDPINVTFEGEPMKVGLQDQKVGKIIITESQKGMLQKGEIIFKINEEYEKGVYIKADGMSLHTEGGLKGMRQSTSEPDCFLALLTFKETEEVGKVVIELNKVTLDRTVPEGNIDLEISGTAIDAYGKGIMIKSFIPVSTKNKENIHYKGLSKDVLTFTIGNMRAKKGDEDMLMDIAPYIEEPGYTMIPLRYVAQGFGIEPQDILYNKEHGTMTLFAGERILQLIKGSDKVMVNNAPVTMEIPVIIKNGRTFISVSEVGKLLGVKAQWDNTNKVATFKVQ